MFIYIYISRLGCSAYLKMHTCIRYSPEYRYRTNIIYLCFVLLHHQTRFKAYINTIQCIACPYLWSLHSGIWTHRVSLNICPVQKYWPSKQTFDGGDVVQICDFAAPNKKSFNFRGFIQENTSTNQPLSIDASNSLWPSWLWRDSYWQHWQISCLVRGP